MNLPFAEPVVLISRAVTGQDADGNDVYGLTETLTAGAFAPYGSTELVQGQNTVIANPTVYLVDGSPVPKATDKVRVRGHVYDIDGEPQVFISPFDGYQPGAVLRLEKVTG